MQDGNGVIKANANVQSRHNASQRNALPRQLIVKGSSSDNGASKPKLTLAIPSDENAEKTSVDALLTGRTATETPSSAPPLPFNASADSSDDALSQPSHEEDDHEEIQHASREGGLSLAHFFQSLRHAQELDPIIPEEVDPDAPSDEEDERLLQRQAMRKLPTTTTKTKPKGVGSPPRPQDRIKMQHSRITRPSSVVNRDIPIDPETVPDAVNPQTISEFRKLKVQVKLAARQERRKQKLAKLEDRYEDVRGYNSLWENFEEIRSQADEIPPTPKLERSDSFDLHDTNTWFFDFQSFDEEDASCYDFDDEQSQSSLSLHSTTSMESQRRYFKEKREGRLRRRTNSDTNLLLMNQIIQTNVQHHKRSTEQVSPAKFKPSHSSISTPPSILRGKTNDATTPAVSDLGTPESRGPVAPRLDAFQIATGQPEYHVYKRPGEEPVTQDGDTPKAKSRRKQAAYTESEEVDMNNDYQVARRRRAPSFNDTDVSILNDDLILKDASILKDEQSVAESLGIILPPSPVKREFDYSSFAIDVMTTDQPEVKVMRMTPEENETCNRKEKIVTGNAARCLEETFSGNALDGSKKQREVKEYRYNEPPRPTIDYMSTEEFLSYSDDHALVKVTRAYGHDILDENSPSGPNDKRNTSPYEDVADDVTMQIDALLAKYRSENEEEVISSGKADERVKDGQVSHPTHT